MASWHTAAALLLAPVAALAQDFPQPLADPLPEAIPKGDIVVAAVPFVRAPKTADPAKPVGTNDAYARIQYLMPIPDGSGRLAFNDLRGILYVTDASGREPVVYLDLSDQDVGFYNAQYPNETGLLGFAFHPQFGDEGRPGYGKLYTAFTAVPAGFGSNIEDAVLKQLMFYVSGQDQEDVIREWAAADPAADVFDGTSRAIFRNAQFAATHNMGTIAFNPYASEGSPDFGLLYASIGDGGSANDPEDNGQDLATPLGAILRIDPLGGSEDRAYGIPADNPFVDRAGAAPEIWAYGIRHAQHFCWDEDGRMFINDIGQDQVEEVNLGIAGGNYGWRLREGTFATAFGADAGSAGIGSVFPLPPTDEELFVYPIAQYDHDEGYAIGSGFVYRGAAIPALQGRYVFADITRGRIFSIATDVLRPGHPAPIEELRLTFDGEERTLLDLAGFGNTYHGGLRADLRLGLDAAGELYLLTKGDGWIRKLVAMPDS
ncbi:MAG: PQQ-dependent sugar dehydrogenase [Gammaproteobacteria bacterium]|nr:PQQ-dependent sugar dehydrogenase [Gammaproteobacteria bacterium]